MNMENVLENLINFLLDMMRVVPLEEIPSPIVLLELSNFSISGY